MSYIVPRIARNSFGRRLLGTSRDEGNNYVQGLNVVELILVSEALSIEGWGEKYGVFRSFYT